MRYKILCLVILFTTLTIINADAGRIRIPDSDHGSLQLYGFFDLRDRETFMQITNTSSTSQTVHIQLFDVSNNCNENNFFDNYTPNDTHKYNIRDILTNDGNPSGVVLPDGAYGIFVATYLDNTSLTLIGNQRIEDSNGYEYRTNLLGYDDDMAFGAERDDFTFNFNTEGGIILSDVIGIQLANVAVVEPPAEVFAADIINIWSSWNVDIYNLDEVPFSCRNVVFACTDQDNPLLEELLEEVSEGDDDDGANVASLEYGINDAIPHTKGGELLCPNNIISEGFVRIQRIAFGDFSGGFDNRRFILYIGLNNGDGRGSMDSIWMDSEFEIIEQNGG